MNAPLNTALHIKMIKMAAFKGHMLGFKVNKLINNYRTCDVKHQIRCNTYRRTCLPSKTSCFSLDHEKQNPKLCFPWKSRCQSENLLNANHVFVRTCTNDSKKAILPGIYTNIPEEKESEKVKTEPEQGKSKWTWMLIGQIAAAVYIVVGAGVCFFYFGSPEMDKEGKEVIDKFSDLSWLQAYYQRCLKSYKQYRKEVAEPSFQKLLPDPMKEPYYQPKYTLVLEMTDILVHPEWQWGTGWRFKKRPGVDYFLQQVGYPKFEVVIYTKENGHTAFSVIDQLDSQGHVPFRLFRDATKWENNTHKKDIRYLNRDLSKIIIVDSDPAAIDLNPRNAILIDPWNGTDEDKVLLDLGTFLNVLATSGVDDIRSVLDNYHEHGADVLETFRKRQQALAELQLQKTAKSKPSLFNRYVKS